MCLRGFASDRFLSGECSSVTTLILTIRSCVHPIGSLPQGISFDEPEVKGVVQVIDDTLDEETRERLVAGARWDVRAEVDKVGEERKGYILGNTGALMQSRRWAHPPPWVRDPLS